MVGRAWEWWRRKKTLVDFLLMLPLPVISLVNGSKFVHDQNGPITTPVFLGLVAGLALPLTWRRRHPRTVFAVISLFALIQWVLGVSLLLADFGFLVALYTVAADRAFRWALAAGLVALLGSMMATTRYVSGWEAQKTSLVALAALAGGAWIFGIYISTRRAYLRSLEERAERLERERDTEVQIAMAAERARIARELHDVVAHNVSVMVVQADGASYAIETDVERAGRALKTISTTGRVALAEMRRLLGVLREDDDAGPYAPQPGVAQLTELVGQIKASGLPLGLQIEGVPRALTEGLELTIFRIVQESLTNILKHGGPAATAQVRLHYGDHAIEVTITDDGRGAGADADGRGHGLVGMRERVAIYDGTVRAGPRAGGGFEVVARLPVREGVRA